MPNINAFRPVVYEKKSFLKIYQNLSYFVPYWAPTPLFEQIWTPIPQACFLPRLVEIGLVVLEKKMFKGKFDGPTDAAPGHKFTYKAIKNN